MVRRFGVNLTPAAICRPLPETKATVPPAVRSSSSMFVPVSENGVGWVSVGFFSLMGEQIAGHGIVQRVGHGWLQRNVQRNREEGLRRNRM
jgi:hypothetical protein